MNQTMRPARKGLDVVLSVDGKVLGGQQDARLDRQMTPIDITNRINPDWSNSLSGTKRWTVSCTGIYIKDAVAFEMLEQAFNTGTKIQVSLKDADREYKGEALVSSFPLSAPYSSACAYTLTLVGCGALE